MDNYPFRSLYVDDNHPFADKSSTKSISLIQNWDSISDKESFPKTKSIVILAQIFKLILATPAVLFDCSMAPSCVFQKHLKANDAYHYKY